MWEYKEKNDMSKLLLPFVLSRRLISFYGIDRGGRTGGPNSSMRIRGRQSKAAVKWQGTLCICFAGSWKGVNNSPCQSAGQQRLKAMPGLPSRIGRRLQSARRQARCRSSGRLLWLSGCTSGRRERLPAESSTPCKRKGKWNLRVGCAAPRVTSRRRSAVAACHTSSSSRGSVFPPHPSSICTSIERNANDIDALEGNLSQRSLARYDKTQVRKDMSNLWVVACSRSSKLENFYVLLIIMSIIFNVQRFVR